MYNLIFSELNKDILKLIVLNIDEPILTIKYNIKELIENLNVRQFDIFINALDSNINCKYNLNNYTLEYFLDRETFLIKSSNLYFHIMLSNRARTQFVKEFKKMLKYILNLATEHEIALFESDT